MQCMTHGRCVCLAIIAMALASLEEGPGKHTFPPACMCMRAQRSSLRRRRSIAPSRRRPSEGTWAARGCGSRLLVPVVAPGWRRAARPHCARPRTGALRAQLRPCMHACSQRLRAPSRVRTKPCPAHPESAGTALTHTQPARMTFAPAPATVCVQAHRVQGCKLRSATLSGRTLGPVFARLLCEIY